MASRPPEKWVLDVKKAIRMASPRRNGEVIVNQSSDN
jgi:hypothetical protein